jgi:hypothetical protein
VVATILTEETSYKLAHRGALLLVAVNVLALHGYVDSILGRYHNAGLLVS